MRRYIKEMGILAKKIKKKFNLNIYLLLPKVIGRRRRELLV